MSEKRQKLGMRLTQHGVEALKNAAENYEYLEPWRPLIVALCAQAIEAKVGIQPVGKQKRRKKIRRTILRSFPKRACRQPLTAPASPHSAATATGQDETP